MADTRRLLILISLFSVVVFAQQPTTKDPVAAAVLAQACNSMGGVPADSIATGTIEITAGGSVDRGRVEIVTIGTRQSRETVETESITRSVTYLSGRASEQVGTADVQPLNRERAVTAQTGLFPLLLLADNLSLPDGAHLSIGEEFLAGVAVDHVRFGRTFADKPELQQLAPFSTRDIWISTTSHLPSKLAYTQRESQGQNDGLQFELYFSDYRNVAGTMYPFSTSIFVNGTQWATINIEAVRFNTGLIQFN